MISTWKFLRGAFFSPWEMGSIWAQGSKCQLWLRKCHLLFAIALLMSPTMAGMATLLKYIATTGKLIIWSNLCNILALNPVLTTVQIGSIFDKTLEVTALQSWEEWLRNDSQWWLINLTLLGFYLPMYNRGCQLFKWPYKLLSCSATSCQQTLHLVQWTNHACTLIDQHRNQSAGALLLLNTSSSFTTFTTTHNFAHG